nr:prevent-host-death protein [Ligilactobacillus ruminis]
MARIFSYSGRHAKISFKFTDKASIFSDVSVNGSDFAKCSAAHHLLNHCI